MMTARANNKNGNRYEPLMSYINPAA
ncbi:uncharacterized protein METZ01_LOCUS353364, partial [marine metagenome]